MSIKNNINVLKKMNKKMYSRLGAEERFKMVIKTFVNGDEGQREKLVNSCPKFTYFESDHAYAERVETSRDIVTIFIIQLLEYDKIISIMKILKGFNSKVQGINDEIKIVSEVQAFLLAFEAFCEEHLGIDSKEMIQAWYGYDERYIRKINKIKEYLDFYQVELDKTLKDIWLEKIFIKGWADRLEAYL
ncbi:hypothetical protein [Priestia sp. P5]|uniref:hypothetical protein n=1 Tax=Priestia sp. P5 TaxID=2917806 RepID=UPI0024057044|nr:hypothetical protein [Priestia sp. P5]MDG0059148.1 hypothetical protein [Priestia sp. P5]